MTQRYESGTVWGLGLQPSVYKEGFVFRERVMFIERHAEGNYKTKHADSAETRLGSTILLYTDTYTQTQTHTQILRYKTKEVKKED